MEVLVESRVADLLTADFDYVGVAVVRVGGRELPVNGTGAAVRCAHGEAGHPEVTLAAIGAVSGTESARSKRNGPGVYRVARRVAGVRTVADVVLHQH